MDRVSAAFCTRCPASSYSQCRGNGLAPAKRWVLPPSALIVSSIVVQIVNGRVTRNGQRAEGFSNENPGRPPAVWTNVTVSPAATGTCRISGLAFVGSSTRNEPTVTGVSPMRSPPEYPWSRISPPSTSIQARTMFANRNSPRRRMPPRSVMVSGGGGS
ncbi:MAG: hypothetical protein JO132_20295 [Streptosporangiaceae bacterium]|nr:hypothetical protein [Streptosporangiaceae bacterium]